MEMSIEVLPKLPSHRTRRLNVQPNYVACCIITPDRHTSRTRTGPESPLSSPLVASEAFPPSAGCLRNCRLFPHPHPLGLRPVTVHLDRLRV